MEAVREIVGPGRPARPRRRRHRPDHPERLAQAGRAHRLRRGAVLRVARELRLRAQPGAVRRARRSSWPGPNFGTGSSREHAPWALEDYGFRAVISPRLRRHLPQQLPEDRAAAGRAPGRRRHADHARRRGRPDDRDRHRRRRPARRGARDRPRRAVRARATSTTTACSRASTTSASPSATTPRSTPSKPHRPTYTPRVVAS